MKFAGQTVTVILTEDGVQVLKLGATGLPESHSITVLVEESEDLGISIKLPRADEIHFFLLRWDYIVALDMPDGQNKPMGLKGA